MWLFLMGHRTSCAQASEKQPDKGEEIIKEIAREIMDFIILNQSLGTKRLCLKPSTEIFETGKKRSLADRVFRFTKFKYFVAELIDSQRRLMSAKNNRRFDVILVAHLLLAEPFTINHLSVRIGTVCVLWLIC